MNDIVFHYIPEQIVKSWCNKDGTLSWLSLESGKREVGELDDGFIEYVVQSGKDEFQNLLDSKEFASVIEKLQKGDVSSLKDDERWIYVLLIFEFYLNPAGYATYHKHYNTIKSGREKELTSEDRTTGDILNLYFKALFYSTYLIDLSLAFVSVPEGSSFILTVNPMFLSNPAFGYFSFTSDNAYIDNGTLIFMPISPYYAVVAYDGFVYKPKKRNGIMVLTEDDVDEYNRLVMSVNEMVVYKDGSTDIDHIMGIREDKRKYTDSYLPSVFQIRARYTEVEEIDGRFFCGVMEMRDQQYFKDNGNLDITEEEFKTRYRQAFQTLEELKED